MAKKNTKKSSRGGEVEFTADTNEMKLRCYSIPIYGQKIWFGLADDIKTLVNKWYTKEDIENDSVLTDAKCLSGYMADNNDVVNYYMFLYYGYTPGDLGHEALHVVNHIFERICAKHPEDEPANYLLGYLMDSFENFAGK